ncbi:MAG TPA: type IV secretion system DNA-binding domain-containing protein [Candidatus Nitrosotalea sp.]|nr:type IV secretion system DNA-binding domain-containing protein [Candidatus Nitrosotalea sp.]
MSWLGKFLGVQSHDPNTILWAGLPVSPRGESGHFLAVGTTGSGKTVLINGLLRTIVPRVASGGARLLLYDGKTEGLSVLRALGYPLEQCVILNPYDARAAAWDMAEDMVAPDDVEALSYALIPPEQTTQPYFDKSARDLLQGVVLSFNARRLRTGWHWTFRDVLNGLSRPSYLRTILEWAPENGPRIEAYFQGAKSFKDVMSTVRTTASRYEVIAAHWWHAQQAGRRFSLRDWMQRGGVVVLGHSHRNTEALNAVNRVLFKRVSDLLLDPHPDRRETWVVLDELSKAGRLQNLDLLLTKGRDLGIRVVLGFQDLSGLEHQDVYGRELTEEMTGVVANKAVLRLQGTRTAKWAEEVFGETEAWEYDVSRGPQGDSVSPRRQVRPTILSSELKSIPPPDERGIQGFYTRADDPYVHEYWIPPHVVASNPRRIAELDFQQAPAAHARLEPWTQAELQELGLGAGPDNDEGLDEEEDDDGEAPPELDLMS